MRPILALACLAALSACAPNAAITAITDGQLVCSGGRSFQAMATESGQPILAKGATATAVQQVCGLLGQIAVALPVGAPPNTVKVMLPSSVTIPLG